MKQATATNNKQTATIFRFAYGLFLILVVFELFIGDYESAVSNFGIALIFDPFNHTIKWNDRPIYQRAWLITHLILLAAGFAFLILR